MRPGTWALAGVALSCLLAGGARGADDPAAAARAVLERHCHRCHGRDGSVEGGMNYVLDRDKLVARRKLVPGRPDQSPLYQRVANGKMPPPDEGPRPTAAEIDALRRWIAAGATAATPAPPQAPLADAVLLDLALADLESIDRRARRFVRYFSLAALANAGAGPDELQTYRNALSKLLNSLSWHPVVTRPRAVDPAGLLLRIDLRDYLWDAVLWNRLLADYPYGVLHDTAVARAVTAFTGTRAAVVRADWLVASACRPPLYYDLLQVPGNLAELERQLRVDPALNLLQERVARAGFNGSGVSRNNRILERHDALTGAYWRTYDFDAVPQNLPERDLLLPDRRNLFAYPLGPGGTDDRFLHAGGEVIFTLPNGLHGFVLVNANNVRIDKGPTAIVSDPRRPDRAVEPCVSCMACHYRGILPKDDQVRDHVAKNARAFRRADIDKVRALYPPGEKMRALMEGDAERYRQALERTGNRVSTAEPVSTITLRYEADVDLPTLAAEAGLRPDAVPALLARSEMLDRNLGALKVSGGTVSRQIVAQSFGELVRQAGLGSPIRPGQFGELLPDASGEVDPLESQSARANAAAVRADGRLVAFAGADKSVVFAEAQTGRELRRGIGHTASVWCVAFSPDGTRLLSGGQDGTLRLWEVATARELARLDGHADLVTAVAFSPDGRHALSAALDHEVILWDLDARKPVEGFTVRGARYVNAVGFAPNGSLGFVAGQTLALIDGQTGRTVHTLNGHTAAATCAAFTADGKWLASGSDDGTVRLWDVATGQPLRVLTGHRGGVRSVAVAGDGRLASAGADATVRLWKASSGEELGVVRGHAEPIVTVAFTEGTAGIVSVGRDGDVRLWSLRPRK